MKRENKNYVKRAAEPYCFWNTQPGGIKQEAYLEIVHNYIDYYYRRSVTYRRWYRIMSVLKFFVLAVIPVGQTISGFANLPWIAASASSLCIMLESLTEFFRMKEKWILYRRVGNELLHEERKYNMQGYGYDALEEEKNLKVFVANIEEIIQNEESEWNRMVHKTELPAKADAESKNGAGAKGCEE